MTPKLTREQRQAIDDQPGQPVYVVDEDRHETFVLLPSCEFDKVRGMFDDRSDNDAWTDQKNARRIELIDKRISGTLTPTESMELDSLQRQAESHFDQVAPPPMKGLVELHQQLIGRDLS